MIEIRPIRGLPEIGPGADLATLIADRAGELSDGDIVAVTSKVVAKAEGRVVRADDREDAISAETVREVARRDSLRIVETRHGLVLAAAGVDASNVAAGHVVLLPVDPDASARSLRARLMARTGTSLAVVITDTAGRPWRQGLADIAVGVAGLDPVLDLRGGTDGYGRPLDATVIALGDELAAAADLVKGKLAGVPVAIIRGLGHLVTAGDGPGAAALVRPPEEDLFRLGTTEAMRAAAAAPGRLSGLAARPVEPGAIARALGAAESPAGRWQLVRIGAANRQRLAEALRAAGVSAADLADRAPEIVVAAVEPGSAAGDRDALLLTLGAAIGRFEVALAAEGLGSTWLFGVGGRADLADALTLPARWVPVAALAIGYPAAEPGG